jgi:ATP-binding cassette subfamily B protein
VGYLEMAMGVLDIPEHLVGIAEARADAARVAEVLCAERITPPTGAVLPPGPGQLAFRDLTVRHDRGHSPLDGVDLTVRAGSMVALVGDENSGKSTLAAAAAGLIVPDGGTALLDGTSVAALDATVARAAVGYAPQRPSLVGATVGEAIALGVVDPIDIGPATRTACIAEFVDRLPHGPRTPLTEVTMSGGELQRLGIARALAGGARLIVLDDATSSLDTVTESLLYTALQDRSVRRTVLTVTHRPATAARADLVAWLENGRLRAVARHADLWRDPAYRAVFGVADEGDTAAEIAGELVAVGAIR